MDSQPGAQLSLGGIKPATATDRLFFAILPDPPARNAIAALASDLHARHALHGRLIDAHRLHITLHHIGDDVCLRQDMIDAASVAADRIDTASFDVAFDSASSFDSKRRHNPYVLRCDKDDAPLQAFRRALGEALALQGLKSDLATAYVPHVTLLYDARIVPPQPIDAIRWTTREFVLVHSLLGQGRHEILRRWPLRF